jgi:hypothetical protein
MGDGPMTLRYALIPAIALLAACGGNEATNEVNAANIAEENLANEFVPVNEVGNLDGNNIVDNNTVDNNTVNAY